MKKRTYWTADKVISTCAILISLMTLVVLILQTSIIREQQRMSVLPYLSVGNYNSYGANFKLMLKNDGIGPAFIESISLTYEDSVYQMDLPVFLSNYIPAFDSIENITHSNIYPGQMIPAGSTLAMLEVNDSKADGLKLIELFQQIDLDMEIIYRSIYEERWKLTDETVKPIKLD